MTDLMKILAEFGVHWFAGTVEHMERRLGAEGLARYRIAISNDEGRYRVDIDASSGELVEVSRELLQIGGV